jgi:hypothetical protein
MASAAEAETCEIWADPPIQVGQGVISGVGHRAGCVQDRDITVRIRKHRRFLRDKTVVELSKSGVINIDLGVKWNCSSGDGGTLFTEILTSAGGKAKSSRVSLICPSF